MPVRIFQSNETSWIQPQWRDGSLEVDCLVYIPHSRIPFYLRLHTSGPLNITVIFYFLDMIVLVLIFFSVVVFVEGSRTARILQFFPKLFIQCPPIHVLVIHIQTIVQFIQ